jgi:hypothetical protein
MLLQVLSREARARPLFGNFIKSKKFGIVDVNV